MATYAAVIQDDAGALKVQVWRAPTTVPTGTAVIAQDFISNNNAGSTSLAITSSTDATPIVLTVATGHGIVAADEILVSGHLVNTSANGAFIVTSVTATTITLKGSIGAGGGAGGATGYFRKLATTASFHVALQDISRAVLNDRSANG